MSDTGEWRPERYRALLKNDARQWLAMHARLRGRFDSSDLVQDALLKASVQVHQCRGSTEAKRIAWLRAILLNEAQDLLRQACAKKRNVLLEQSLHTALAESSARLEHLLAQQGSSPGEKAVQNELVKLLTDALEALPEDQREAVTLRYMKSQKVSEIAETMKKTDLSVSGLLRRGLQALRERLGHTR